MAKPGDTPILQVLESFSRGNDVYRKGELIEADHPLVREIPQFFGPVTVHHKSHRSPAVEQATAAPGEKRGR